MRQAKPEELQKAHELLRALEIKRGGKVLEFQKRIANDTDLLTAYTQTYDSCSASLTHLPRKYRELIIMAIGCALRVQTTINTHAKLAVEHGATIEELGETLKLVFFLAGTTSLISAAEVFDPVDYQ